ncbi:unnamed protein product [Musa acuminata subsp. burmannicoides]
MEFSVTYGTFARVSQGSGGGAFTPRRSSSARPLGILPLVLRLRSSSSSPSRLLPVPRLGR